MSELYTVLRYPDPRLRTVAKYIDMVDSRIEAIAAKMLATMYALKGVGLAATQVDIHERMFVMDVAGGKEPIILINPEIIWRGAEKMKAPEGCLSVPQQGDMVERHKEVRVEYTGLNGLRLVREAEGFKAVCVQHEIDHLDGKVFVDYLSSMKRQRILGALSKDVRR
jgi:peptide deformylase